MKKKYVSDIECTICGAEFNTGKCYTKLGRWIKAKLIQRKHWHTQAEVACKQATGVYIPTIEKDWEK